MSNRKNLVFTSAGGNTDFIKWWLKEHREYDVWVIFYGDDDEKYKEYESEVEFIEKRKGDKWQNFYYTYNKYKKELSHYERFFVLDDDIVITTTDINNMFEISEKCKLWICQPSFDDCSRLGHLINKHVPQNYLRFTNFVENNTPLMTRKSVDNFFKIYNPDELDPHGTDFIFIWANGYEHKRRYAIIDKIKCINPMDRIIDGKKVRDCLNLNTLDKQVEKWRTFHHKNKLYMEQPKVHESIINNYQFIAHLEDDWSPMIEMEFKERLNFPKNEKNKIAFLFLTRNNLKQPKLWYDFLSDGIDRCSIYVHTKERDRITQQFLKDNQIEKHIHTKWGDRTLVEAANELIKEAIKDTTNKYFVLVSESCIPIRKFGYIYGFFEYFNKSCLFTRITPIKHPEIMELQFSRIKSPEKLNLTIDNITRNSQWMALNRHHAEIIANNDYLECYEDFPISDEWYHYNVLQKHDPDLKDNYWEYRVTYFDYAPLVHKYNGWPHPIEYNSLDELDFEAIRKDYKSLFLRKVSQDMEITYDDLIP